ncbi:MAG: ribosome biogenesis factor YjgA [Kofleriaceae bacterium]
MRSSDRSNREIARGKIKREGDRSARIARQLMQLKEPLLKKLVIDLELKDAIIAARAITSPNARRRAERTIAGELRSHDLAALDAKLAKVHESNNLDTEAFHLAEKWRARLIEEGIAAAAELTYRGDEAELGRLIDAARKERDTGRPPGAQRKLFRHVVELLKHAEDPEVGDDSDADEVEDADEKEGT